MPSAVIEFELAVMMVWPAFTAPGTNATSSSSVIAFHAMLPVPVAVPAEVELVKVAV